MSSCKVFPNIPTVCLIFLIGSVSLFAQVNKRGHALGVGLGVASLEQNAAALRLEYAADKIFGTKPNPFLLNFRFSSELLNTAQVFAVFHGRIGLFKKFTLFRHASLFSAGARGDVSSGKGREGSAQAFVRSTLYKNKFYRWQLQGGLAANRLNIGAQYDYIAGFGHIAFVFRPGRGQQMQIGLAYERTHYSPGDLYGHNLGGFADYSLSGKSILHVRLRFEHLSMDKAARADTGFWFNFSFGRFLGRSLSFYLYSDVYLPLQKAGFVLPRQELKLLRRNRYGLKLLWQRSMRHSFFVTTAFRQWDIRTESKLNSLFVWAGITFYFGNSLNK